jgi:hypothetical protein
MSYARWSTSAWYAFYNVNGKLSLWYDIDNTIDWEHEELKQLVAQDPEKVILFLSEIYKCTATEAKEAVDYIQRYISEYDPVDGENYKKEVAELLKKWNNDQTN